MKDRRTLAWLILVALGCACAADPRAVFLEGWFGEHAPGWSVANRRTVVEALLSSEMESGTDAFLLLAVIEEESRYDPMARSRRGARGLMQIRPETGRDVATRVKVGWSGPADLDDPAKNVRLGAAYLAELKERFGRWETALAAYHEGPTKIRRIQRRGGRIPKRYASRVLRRWERIREAYGGAL